MKAIIFIDSSQVRQNRENIGYPYDRIAAKIMEGIKSICSQNEVPTLTHTCGTNLIEMDIRSKGSKLIKNLALFSIINGAIQREKELWRYCRNNKHNYACF